MSNAGMNAIYNGAFAQGLQMSNSVGLGRHRRHHAGKRSYHHHDHHHDHGRGIMDFVRKGHAMLKDKKLISKGLDSLKGIAERAGYGRRRRTHAGRRRRHHAGAKIIRIVISPRKRGHGGRKRRTHRRHHY